MEGRFRDQSYDQLEDDPHFTGGWPPAVVKAYRNRLNYIRQAQDERDLYAWRSLRMEKLQGRRQHQHSLRLNDQWRLVILESGVKASTFGQSAGTASCLLWVGTPSTQHLAPTCDEVPCCVWAQSCSSECTFGLTWACCSGSARSNTPRHPRESRWKRLAAPSGLCGSCVVPGWACSSR